MADIKVQSGCKIATIKAPEGDYRQIVLDYMMKMSQIKWTGIKGTNPFRRDCWSS